MKRQTGSVSMDAQEGVEQNERNETKRLKLLHRVEGDQIHHDEAGPSVPHEGPDASVSYVTDTTASNDTATPNEQGELHNLTPNEQGQIHNLSPNENNNSFSKHKNGAIAKTMDGSNHESSPKTNGDQHSTSEEHDPEPSNHCTIEQDSPLVHLQLSSEQASVNGSMNISDTEFSFTMPKYILEDSSGDSSQSDTDIENSPSPGDSKPTEVIVENCMPETSTCDSRSPHNCSGHPSDLVPQQAQVNEWNFDIEHMTTSLLEVTQLEGHADYVFSIAADEDVILSSSGDTTIKVWNATTKSELCSFRGHTDAVTSVILLSKDQSKELCSNLSLNEGLRLAMSASLDCYIKLWSISDGEELISLYTFNGITCMDYLESQFSAVVGTDGGKIEVWNFNSQTMNSVFAHEESISGLQVCDTYVHSASVDGSVKVWLFEENEFQPLYTRRRKELTANKKEFNPTQWKSLATYDNILYLGDNTYNLKVLDWQAGKMRLFRNQMKEPAIIDAILAKNNILLSTFHEYSSDSGGINVYELPSMSYVCTIMGNVQEIGSLDMTKTSDGKLRIVSGGHQLLVWDFDFTQAASNEPIIPAYYACEIKDMGTEVMNEIPYASSPLVSGTAVSTGANNSESDKSSSWCNVM